MHFFGFGGGCGQKHLYGDSGGAAAAMVAAVLVTPLKEVYLLFGLYAGHSRIR